MKKVFYEKNFFNFIFAVIFITGVTLIWVSIAFVMQRFFDIIAQNQGYEIHGTIYISLFLIMLYFILGVLRDYFKHRFIERALNNYKLFLHEKIFNLSVKAFEKHTTGDYISSLTNDTNIIENEYLDGLFNLLENSLLLIGSILAMIIFSPIMFLCVLLTSIIPMLSSVLFGKKSLKYEIIVSEQNQNFINKFKDNLSGFSVIKSYSVEDKYNEDFSNANSVLERSKYNKRFLISFVENFTVAFGFIVYISVIIVGAFLVARNEITIGVVVAFVQLINYVVVPIRNLPIIQLKMRNSNVLIEKAVNISKERHPELDKIELSSFLYGIKFSDVTLAMNSKHKALERVSIDFLKGKCYAIVGLSGSGKSTALKAIMGYFDNYKGEIKFDDNELREISAESLSRLLSYIQQDVYIFDDTIEANITMKCDFCSEVIEDVFNKTGISKLITQKGKNYRCGENGVALSGGEKQKIAIARCLLKKTPVLLIDEATSSLDAYASADFEEMILSLENYTRVVVTHKLNVDTLKRYDEIIVINNGKIAEKGTFYELVKSNSYLYSLLSINKESHTQ